MAKQGPPRDTGVPMWYITFADLSTLMLTFFVLLISFANMDIVKFREMLGSVQEAFGVPEERIGEAVPYLTGEEAFEETKKKETPISATKREQIEGARDDLETISQNSKLSKNMTVFIRNNKVVLRVDGGTFFVSGSAKIRRDGLKILKRLGELLATSTFSLTIEGHTDNVPIKTTMYPSNWELSGVRATSVLRYLERVGVPTDKMHAIGYADTRPIAPNDTKESRAKNRRVEFILSNLATKDKKGEEATSPPREETSAPPK